MGEALSFEAVIEGGPGGGAYVAVPFDVKEAFGSGRPKVRALIDGHEYRGSIADMGAGHCLGVRKDVRASIQKAVGDTVRVVVEVDTEAREVSVPAELQIALRGTQEAEERYALLSFTHRREFAEWVAQAKQQETRDRRAEKAVSMLLEGRTR